jgi:hypothetical protein
MVAAWLTPTPEGGEPLHSTEKAAGVPHTKLGKDAAIVARDSPVLIRYAEDLTPCVTQLNRQNRSRRGWPPG